jgi:predicted RNase H-like HicB family nuclease
MPKRRYVVVLEEGPNNWGAYVPDVWGCVSTGKTREEAERNIREALEFHFESLRDHHEPIPAPGTWTAEVEVAVPDTVRQSAVS